MGRDDWDVRLVDGRKTSAVELLSGGPGLVVNVASLCGYTQQYEQLQQLHERYAGRATVIGVPCNQFADEEPGDDAQIAAFAADTYGVTFPLLAKVEVNGPGRLPWFAALCKCPDSEDGHVGDVRWNFEKFVVNAEGVPLERFSPATDPLDWRIAEALDVALGVAS